MDLAHPAEAGSVLEPGVVERPGSRTGERVLLPLLPGHAPILAPGVRAQGGQPLVGLLGLLYTGSEGAKGPALLELLAHYRVAYKAHSYKHQRDRCGTQGPARPRQELVALLRGCVYRLEDEDDDGGDQYVGLERGPVREPRLGRDTGLEKLLQALRLLDHPEERHREEEHVRKHLQPVGREDEQHEHSNPHGRETPAREREVEGERADDQADGVESANDRAFELRHAGQPEDYPHAEHDRHRVGILDRRADPNGIHRARRVLGRVYLLQQPVPGDDKRDQEQPIHERWHQPSRRECRKGHGKGREVHRRAQELFDGFWRAYGPHERQPLDEDQHRHQPYQDPAGPRYVRVEVTYKQSKERERKDHAGHRDPPLLPEEAAVKHPVARQRHERAEHEGLERDQPPAGTTVLALARALLDPVIRHSPHIS